MLIDCHCHLSFPDYSVELHHHHLLIDVTEIPLLDKPIPKDDHHLHFGGGQTETTLELSPGPHTLQLIFGDKDHMPFDPPVMSDRITINVK